MSELAVPDKIAPEVGWRAWRMAPEAGTGEPTLLSLNSRMPWPRRDPLRAACLAGDPARQFVITGPMISASAGEPTTAHFAPGSACQCGIYAVTDVKQAFGLFDACGGGSLILGEVRLWGRVVPGERGWRAEYAYPHKLYVVPVLRREDRLLALGCDEATVRQAAAVYDVEVGILDEAIVREVVAEAEEQAAELLRRQAAQMKAFAGVTFPTSVTFPTMTLGYPRQSRWRRFREVFWDDLGLTLAGIAALVCLSVGSALCILLALD